MKNKFIYTVESRIKKNAMFVVRRCFSTIEEARKCRQDLLDDGHYNDIKIIVEDIDVNPYEK